MAPLDEPVDRPGGGWERQAEVRGEPAQRDRAIDRYVVQQVPLVLAEIRCVRPVERTPDPAVQYLEMFSV